VKTTATPFPIALWLDPESTLSAEHCQALQDAGWAATQVSTLDEAVSQAPHAAAIILIWPMTLNGCISCNSN